MTKKQLQARVKALEAQQTSSKEGNLSTEEMAATIASVVHSMERQTSPQAQASSPAKKVSFVSENDSYKIATQALQKVMKRKRGDDSGN